MRLGGFWGITGPMLVIATKQNGLESILPMLNAASSNREIITDLKSELVYLLHAIDKIPKKYFPPDNFPTIESFDKSIRYANGKLFAEGIDEQDFYMSLATGCVIYLLKKHSKSGTNFSLELKPVSGIDDPACIDNRLTVINKVKEIIKDDDFYLSSLANEYLSLKDTLDLTITDRDRYKELYEVSDAKNLKLEKENSKFVEGYADIVQKVFKLNTSLKTYESVLSADVYEKVDLTKYTNRPLIIYFKEFEDLIYLDTFIETLYYVFTNQYHKSVKVVRLYDSAKTRKLSTLPNYYYRLYNKFTSEEAIVHNFICKTADYRKLFDVLLTNNSNLDVLLVFDHKDLNDLIFSGSYLQFNLCRTLKHLESYNIKKENTIVNFAGDEENGISWDYYPELKTEEMKDRERRFLFLSSRPVITRIYALSKFFAESI